jgi:hypothetical protein
MRYSKVVEWTAENLNEYAGLIYEDKPVPNHTPDDPEYWFFGLVNELGPLPFENEGFRKLLTEQTLALVDRNFLLDS